MVLHCEKAPAAPRELRLEVNWTSPEWCQVSKWADETNSGTFPHTKQQLGFERSCWLSKDHVKIGIQSCGDTESLSPRQLSCLQNDPDGSDQKASHPGCDVWQWPAADPEENSKYRHDLSSDTLLLSAKQQFRISTRLNYQTNSSYYLQECHITCLGSYGRTSISYFENRLLSFGLMHILQQEIVILWQSAFLLTWYLN